MGQTVGEVIASRDATHRSRRQGADATRLAEPWRREGRRRDHGRRAARTGVVLSRRPRHAGRDRVVRPVRDRQAQGRRDRASSPRRPARSAASSASSRRSRGCRAVGIAGGAAKCDYVDRRARLRRLRRLQASRRSPATTLCERHARTASTSISRTSAAMVLDAALRVMNRHSRVVTVRPGRRVQREGPVRLSRVAIGAGQPHPDAGDDHVRLEGPLRRGVDQRSRRTLPRASSSTANRSSTGSTMRRAR